MYLSRLDIDSRSRAVRRDLGNVQAMHRTVMAGFPDVAAADPRAHHGVLWRLEPDARRERIVVLVQSSTLPDWSRLSAEYLVEPAAVKLIASELSKVVAGARFRFRIVANPTRKIDIRSGPDGIRRNGRRVPLRGEAALLDWLIRKGVDSGFSVGERPEAAARSVVVRSLGDASGRRGQTHEGRAASVTFRGIAFDGILTVTDPDRLRSAVSLGLGTGKAYGYGLLSLAAVSSQ